MNQAQRKFLIDKIQAGIKETDKVLEESLPDEPKMDGYLLQALFAGTLEIRTKKSLMDLLKTRAARNVNSWLTANSWSSKSDRVEFKLEDFFVTPEQYQIDYDAWKKETERIEGLRRTMRMQSEGLCTRIQLASNKTLEKMIAEVDDMGDISLVDCTLKALMSNTGENKLLEDNE